MLYISLSFKFKIQYNAYVYSIQCYIWMYYLKSPSKKIHKHVWTYQGAALYKQITIDVSQLCVSKYHRRFYPHMLSRQILDTRSLSVQCPKRVKQLAAVALHPSRSSALALPRLAPLHPTRHLQSPAIVQVLLLPLINSWSASSVRFCCNKDSHCAQAPNGGDCQRTGSFKTNEEKNMDPGVNICGFRN